MKRSAPPPSSSSSSSPTLATPRPHLEGDRLNVALLIFLYVLQGIPLGLANAIPLVLTKHHVSYREQAEFSFAFWPFALKLLWAPIVDSCYVSAFGRRKTWLVPTQYLIAITMFALSMNVDYYMGSGEYSQRAPQVAMLTAMFFFLNFLAATQDIAVDGWALTMLRREHVGYASTCNTVGQTAGYFFGYVVYLALDSYNLVSLRDFLVFWAVVFLVATTLVAIFKHENNSSNSNKKKEVEPDFDVFQTYKLLGKIVTLPMMPTLIFVLLTAKIGFSAADSVAGLKLIEQGVPKETLAMLSVPLVPLQILLPILISRYTAGPRPMDVFLKAFPPRLIMGAFFALVVYITPSFQVEAGHFPWHFYAMLVAIYAAYQVCLFSMYVSIMAFFARISDPVVGGTYMTLLNTLTNLGGNWSSTMALWFVDTLTTKKCQLEEGTFDPINTCHGSDETDACTAEQGTCITLVEGYYVESLIFLALGFLWLIWGWPTIKKLQQAELDGWQVVTKTKQQKA